jgi:hypothetical protein
MRKSLIFIVLTVLLAAAPALAGPVVLTQGADLWHTVTGFSYSSFADNPIPAGFFCEGSKPFTGIVQLTGEPLVTLPAGALGNIDTIVRRLDDAKLDANGESSTRIQLLALSLASTRPVDTGCGLYNVKTSLDGEQPITEMKLKRTHPEGGTYIAPLSLRAKMVFTPVSGKGAPHTFYQTVNLGPGSASVWSYVREKRLERVQVDTDGDNRPDTYLPMPSNFKVGLAVGTLGSTGITGDTDCYKIRQSCHCAWGSTNPAEPNSGCAHLHCTQVKLRCSEPDPPTPPSGVPYITTDQAAQLSSGTAN